ncbi:MAG: hypothetical protein J0M11_04510 [Anaerolineae bacterium]|nr:hypothetical protein [Anaerolineae bacterium]
MSTKGKLVRLLANAVLKRAIVVDVQKIGGFQRLLLQCDDVQRFSAGTKVQLLLPSDDMRTYTPIPSADGMVLLAWKHIDGPGALWMSNAQMGEELWFIGPQHSLTVNAGPAIIIGDETSIAVAAAFESERPGQIQTIIQTEAASEVRDAARSVGLHQIDIIARGDTVSTVRAVTAKLSISPNALVALTGGSELVVSVREALRSAGVQNIKTKAYWVRGKTGLD